MTKTQRTCAIDAGDVVLLVRPRHEVNQGRSCVVVKALPPIKGTTTIWWLCAFEEPVLTDSGMGRLALVPETALVCLAKDSFEDSNVRLWLRLAQDVCVNCTV